MRIPHPASEHVPRSGSDSRRSRSHAAGYDRAMNGPVHERGHGQSLLTRISNEVVRMHKEFFGKGPSETKSYFVDDMLLVVMKGGVTTAEHSMVDFGQEAKVRDFRQTFQDEMTERLTQLVEELTQRNVINYQSQIMFDPDRVIEMFVFDRPRSEAIEPTAEAQLAAKPAGEAERDELLGPAAPAPPTLER